MNERLESLRGSLIVSCQAPLGDPLHDPRIMVAFAQSAVAAGARGIRANEPDDISAIRAAVAVPIIGLYKQDRPGFEVRITPTLEAARAISEAGADIVALDATLRPHPEGWTAGDLIAAVKAKLGMPVMADISTFEEAVNAAAAGADLISTTLSGYTAYSRQQQAPDIELIREVTGAVSMPVVAEGRIASPDHARAAMEAGAFAVVVGTAITRPHWITQQFVMAIMPLNSLDQTRQEEYP